MRLGILGGTFDPVHLGHLLVAEQAREVLALDRVLFVPAGRPPHKPPEPITPFALRLRMVSLALDRTPGFLSSELEGDETRASYTVETLRRLRGQLGEADEVFLLLGEDSLLDLPGWREPEEIQRLARIAVYPRPGIPPGDAPTPPAGVMRLDGPRLQLSSTEIRARAQAGKSIRFLVPEPVRLFIQQQGLYRDRPSAAPTARRPGGERPGPAHP